MFDDWHGFYQLLGSAAGALIGLLFVVATLTIGRDHRSVQRGISLYMTPNLFHFGVVLLVGATVQAPRLAPAATAGIIAVAAATGFVYCAATAVLMRRGQDPAPHWSDFWCYAVLPAVIYLALAAAALATGPAPATAPFAVAALLVVLLFVAIRNAWDLVTWLSPRRNGNGNSNSD
jgi:hypothetical protein